MRAFNVAILLLLACVDCFDGDVNQQRYDGDRVVSIHVPNKETWETVTKILNDYIPVKDQDIWMEPRARDQRAFIMVPSFYWSQVSNAFDQADISYIIKIPDVQKLITESLQKNEAAKRFNKQIGGNYINGTFPRYDEIVAWMQDVTRSYPELASYRSIGTTVLNRQMQILKLGLGTGNKWRVWIDAGLHAREWLAPTTAIYVANKLISSYANGDQSVIDILNFFDFYIIPVANPDGYENCHTTERLWRKNMRRINVDCVGVDLNRNFAFQWGGVNADANPCSNLYMGPYAESEVEVQNIVRFIMADAPKFLMYHAYHTWGELFFTRWDYTGGNAPSDHTELFDLAARSVNSINHVHGERYEAGIAPTLMYPFAGSSSDWARGVANIKYPFLTELRDFGGDYAFVAPPEEIEPCGEENWQGMYSVLVRIMELWAGTEPPL